MSESRHDATNYPMYKSPFVDIPKLLSTEHAPPVYDPVFKPGLLVDSLSFAIQCVE